MKGNFTNLPSILKKGDLLKKSEIMLMIKEGVPKPAIAEALKMSEKEFYILCESWNIKGRRVSKSSGKCRVRKISPDEYNEACLVFKKDDDIARHFGITKSGLSLAKKRWRKKGIVVSMTEIEKNRISRQDFTLEVYQSLKDRGLMDKEIAEMFGFGKNYLTKLRKKWGFNVSNKKK